jgi:hypothetical protein
MNCPYLSHALNKNSPASTNTATPNKASRLGSGSIFSDKINLLSSHSSRHWAIFAQCAPRCQRLVESGQNSPPIRKWLHPTLYHSPHKLYHHHRREKEALKAVFHSQTRGLPWLREKGTRYQLLGYAYLLSTIKLGTMPLAPFSHPTQPHLNDNHNINVHMQLRPC